MKKIIMALIMTLFAVVFAVTASAATVSAPGTETPEAQGVAEAQAVHETIRGRVHALLKAQKQNGRLDGVALDALGREISAITREEYLAAGWREVETVPHSAEEVRTIVSKEVDPKAVRLAYRDLAKAPEEWKDYILSARREVIYRFSWAADPTEDTFGYGADDDFVNRTFEISPRFSDLFPGWYEPRLDLVLPSWKDAPETEDMAGNPASCSVWTRLVVDASAFAWGGLR